MVETGGAHADEAKVLRSVKDFLVDLGVYAHDQDFVGFDDPDEGLLRRQHHQIHFHVLLKFAVNVFVNVIDHQALHLRPPQA